MSSTFSYLAREERRVELLLPLDEDFDELLITLGEDIVSLLMGTGAIKRIDDKKYRVRKCLIENHKGESR